MNHKLFYQDAYLQSFQANIVRQDQDNNGNWYVLLSQTAFYPTGGGQPFDTGTLNHARVINVEEIDGEIYHYIDRKIEDLLVEGRVEWERRFDHMQQHAGQHILSAAFVELTGYETVSFHLGSELLTIDLNTTELTQQELEKVEFLANEIILENRTIQTKWVTKNEVAQYPLRKQLSVTENIRLVIIPDFDYNGCGGTHPSSTGQVSSIKILDWERQKEKVRVYFVCGARVRKQLQQKHSVLKEVGKLVSSSEQLMVETVQKLLSRNGEQDKTISELREQLLLFEAQKVLQGNLEGSIITHLFHNRSIQELQKLARHIIASTNEENIVLLVTENEDLVQMVFACGSDSSFNMNSLMKEVLPIIQGKGGGSPVLAQGGGKKIVSGKEIIQQALKVISK
ncbi:alanyl-tRNA synthetase [Bacillus mesophilus]|uniref:Alanine--tRNA ligase n=1 Tax=Bacillus mesophilus TaxID=1808955 RepID=A0A6M0QCN6_9BACI|nr:DHHA1 domain-containing protein [Bacillus mesophilus]MBM7662645.1 alanyl-tRNA synthetase [Bacillus mesophilus]NEY73290.1 alanyl-tRNA editing protein [Bacillus mesophilus]